MHIKKIFIESFGKLERLTLDLSEGLNVIYGENEIGKSSISAFIKYMLYGFSHANKRSVAENDKKHYLSWSNDQASGYIDLVSGGTSYKIVRKTTSKNEEVILYDMDKGEKVNVKGEIGEYLLGVPYETYASCALVLQGDGLTVGGSVLSEQLQNILFSADEDISSKKALSALEKERVTLRHKTGKDGRLWELTGRKQMLLDEFEKAKKENAEYIALRSSREKLLLESERNAELLRESTEEYERFELYQKTLLLDELDKLKKETLEKKKHASELSEKLYKPWTKESSGELELIARDIRASENALKEAREKCLELCEQSRDYEDVHGREVLTKDLEQSKRIKRTRKALGVFAVILLLAAASAAVLGYLQSTLGSLGEMQTLLLYAAAGIGALLAIVLFIISASKKKKLWAIRAKYGDKDVEEAAGEMLERIAKREEHERAKASAEFTEGECRKRYAEAINKAGEYFGDTSLEAKALFEKIIYEQRSLKICDEAWSEVEVSARSAKRLMESTDFEYLRKIKETVPPPEKTQPQIKRENDFLKNKQSILTARLHETETKLEVLKATAKEPAEVYARLAETEEALVLENRRFEALELAVQTLTEAGGDLRRGVSPKIAQYARELLEKASHGKYGAIIADKEMSLQLEIDGIPRSIDYLSSGTKDLVYVAFRYGLARLLFSDSLPTLIFDDSFGRIDDKRLRELLELIYELSGETQIMIFTCHKRESEMLSKHKINNIIL